MRKINYLTVFLLFLIACSKESNDPSPNQPYVSVKDEDDFDNYDCSNVSYQLDIVPIFLENCENCHLNGGSFSGIKLDEHDNVTANLERILGVVRKDEKYASMPPIGVGDSLNEQEIKLIECWVENGALNN